MNGKQSRLKDHMHWSDAVRNNLLFCDNCGEKIDQGCLTDADGRITCCECE